jgi:hypothetical protein
MRIHLILGATLAAATTLGAQTVFGKYGGEFMALGVGGRALGMGGAAATATDVTAGYYNPAGLAALDYPQISMMHDERYGDLIDYNYAAVALPHGEDLTFALGAIRLGVDGIYDTRDALYDANGDGALDIWTDRLDYDKVTEFGAQDWAIYASGAKRVSDKLSVGASVKAIYRSLAEYDATGVGIDVGAQYAIAPEAILGVVARDVTTTLTAWSTGRNELIPPTLKTGAAYFLPLFGGVFAFAADLDFRFENRGDASQLALGFLSADAHAGFEFDYADVFAVRAGFTDVNQFTVGAGVRLPKLRVDYSFARFALSEDERLPDSHRVSFVLTLEQEKYRRGN